MRTKPVVRVRKFGAAGAGTRRGGGSPGLRLRHAGRLPGTGKPRGENLRWHGARLSSRRRILPGVRPSEANRERPCPPAAAFDVPPLPDGWQTLSRKVLSGPRLATLGVNADLHGALRSDRERKTVCAAGRVVARATARVWVFDGDRVVESVEFPLLEPFPMVEQFPDGRWLVTAPRVNGEGSARILGANGAEERRIELGHSVSHLKIDSQQRIWVGWSDSGIFGNNGWRVPEATASPSAYGVAAFDERGTLIAHAPFESIADCYALNVCGDAAWACTYTGFPIWQITPDRERRWPTDLSGPQALAVDYPYVLAAGGYRDEANRVVLLRLDHRRTEPLGEWRLPFGVGTSGVTTMMDGRDDELHVVMDGKWLRWTVREFAMVGE